MGHRILWACTLGIAVEMVASVLVAAAVVAPSSLAVLLTAARIMSWAVAGSCFTAILVMTLLVYRHGRPRR